MVLKLALQGTYTNGFVTFGVCHEEEQGRRQCVKNTKDWKLNFSNTQFAKVYSYTTSQRDFRRPTPSRPFWMAVYKRPFQDARWLLSRKWRLLWHVGSIFGLCLYRGLQKKKRELEKVEVKCEFQFSARGGSPCKDDEINESAGNVIL